MQNALQTQITPQINLQSHRDDPFFAAIIDYLKEGTLPSDKNMAQRVLFQTDDFFHSRRPIVALSMSEKLEITTDITEISSAVHSKMF
jgi:hypothetical protein